MSSPNGCLSRALRRIENEYVRRFNRRRRRDGPLVRGRFCSRRVDTLGYFVNVVRYIDRNPVEAGLAPTPWDYPFGSARAYVTGRRIPWLDRQPVEAWIRTTSGQGASFVEEYKSRVSAPLGLSEREAIERGVRRGNPRLETLGPVAAAGTEVRANFDRKARLADGMRGHAPVVDAETVRRAVESLQARDGPWRLRRAHRAVCGWRLLLAGLLRDWCGEPQQTIAARVGLTRSGLRDALQVHWELLATDADYARRTDDVRLALPPEWRTTICSLSTS